MVNYNLVWKFNWELSKNYYVYEVLMKKSVKIVL